MDIERVIIFWNKQLISIKRNIKVRLLIQLIIISVILTSCDSDPYGSNWGEEDSLTISQFLDKNQEEYSKFYRMLVEGKMLSTLYAYNPYGDDYTLFLPTDEAIDHFIQQNKNYESFEELFLDTGFVNLLTRYHTIKRKVHTDEFPDGAMMDSTLTGDRLAIGFYTDGDLVQYPIFNGTTAKSLNLTS